MMANHIQFLNLQLIRKQNLIIALTHIFGIGYYLSNTICKKYGFTKFSRLEDVPMYLLNEVRKFILTNYPIQNSLKSRTFDFIQDLIVNHSIRGLRHKLKLPVRGQRTRTNHKTQKRLHNT